MDGQGMGDMPMAMSPMGMGMGMGMHMTFFWGKDVDILFSGWPGHSLGMYILALLVVFVLAVLIEWLSCGSRSFIKPAANRVEAGLFQTLLHTLRMGFGYLVMLAVMSFNVGVLIAALLGHALGFLLFGTRLFKRSHLPEDQTNTSNGLPPMH